MNYLLFELFVILTICFANLVLFRSKYIFFELHITNIIKIVYGYFKLPNLPIATKSGYKARTLKEWFNSVLILSSKFFAYFTLVLVNYRFSHTCIYSKSKSRKRITF